MLQQHCGHKLDINISIVHISKPITGCATMNWMLCCSGISYTLFMKFIIRGREVLASEGFSDCQYPVTFIKRRRFLWPIVTPTLRSLLTLLHGHRQTCSVPPPHHPYIISWLMVVLLKDVLSSTAFWYNQAFFQIDIDNQRLLLVSIKQYELALMSDVKAFDN